MVQYARGFEDPEWYQRYIHASDRDLRGYSPNRRDSERPIFAMRAINDAPSFSGAIREWDLSDEDVSGLVVPGKHMGNPRKPPIYRANARRGLRWLARRAGLPAA
jgi:hypothetical protein